MVSGFAVNGSDSRSGRKPNTSPLFCVSLILAALIMCIGVFLRLQRLSQDPLWHDEILTIVRIRDGNKITFNKQERAIRQLDGASLANLIQESKDGPERGGVYMPAFYRLSGLFSRLFDDTRVGVKSLSTVCGSLLIFGMAVLAIQVSGNAFIAVAVSVFVAFNPTLIAYSVEARPYSLLLLLIVSYLNLLSSAAGTSIAELFFFLLIVVIGALTHLVFLPLAWFAFFLQLLLTKGARGVRLVQASCLLISLLIALPFIIPVLASAEAKNHFTSVPLSSLGIVQAMDQGVGYMVGMALPELPYVGVISLCVTVLVAGMLAWSGRYLAGSLSSIALSLILPYVGMIVADIILGGTRSTVVRYSLSAALGFALLMAALLGRVWQWNRLFATLGLIILASFELYAPCAVNQQLKGGRYDELAWYMQKYGARECRVLSTLTGDRVLEFAVNSDRTTRIIRDAVPTSLVDLEAWMAQGIPVLAISSPDEPSPRIPGRKFYWRDEWDWSQTTISRLTLREGAP